MSTDGATTAGRMRGPKAGGRSQADFREVRERLAQGTLIKPEFEFELLSMLARAELSLGFVLPALAVLFAGVLLFWVPPVQAMLWLAGVALAKGASVFAARTFLATPRTGMRAGTWRQRLLMLEAANGLAWAALPLVVALNPAPAAQLFLAVALVTVMATRMTVAAPALKVFLAGTLPFTLAAAGVLLLQASAEMAALAALLLVLQVAFLVLARRLNDTALAMVEFKAEKDALIAEVEAEKGICNEARRNAEAASMAKSRFLATMSHELRTPLNAILGFSEVMMCEVLGPMHNARYKEYAGSINDSGKHLLQLINEILDLSRIEAGRYELHEEAVRLTDIVEDCLRLLHLRAESKGLEVVLEFPKGLDLIWADERALRQICLNLISNALKFTPRGGQITLHVYGEDDGGQTFSVRDNGPGIPKDEIPRVMEAFGQGSLAHHTAEGGTGLGLPIVNNLVALHGGRFELRSELRKGTEAIVRLPQSRVLVAVPPLQPLGKERHRQAPVRSRGAITATAAAAG